MGSQIFEATGKLFENDFATESVPEPIQDNKEYKREIVWKNVFYLCYFHVAAVYGLYLLITSASIYTSLFGK